MQKGKHFNDVHSSYKQDLQEDHQKDGLIWSGKTLDYHC